MELKQMKRQGRGPGKPFKSGEESPNAILTENDVKDIRNKYFNGLKVKQICEYTGMSETAIRCIVKYKTWKHIK